MSQKTVFLLLLLGTTPCLAESLRFLGAKAYTNQKGESFQIPAGAFVEKTGQTDQSIQVRYKDQTMEVPLSETATYFESVDNYIGSCLDRIIEANTNKLNCSENNANKKDCPLADSSTDTSRDVLTKVIEDCSPTSDLKIVERTDTLSLNDYKKACRKDNIPKSKTNSTWAAPIPLPFCTPAEEKIINENSLKKHKAFMAACPDKNPDMSRIGLVAPEPECSLASASKEKITKIVLHATEGASTFGPGRLFCDYEKTGYSDLPYHYYIAKDPVTKKWSVYEGRKLKYQGAHVRANLNADSIGIAIAGHYEPGGPSAAQPYIESEAPPAEAVQLAQSLIAKLKKEYPSINDIQGHGEALYQGNHCHKNCPGPGCQFVINRFKEKFFSDKKSE